MDRARKPALLCIVPPYTTLEPPAGLAYLLGFAKNAGCHDFGFLDLRLGLPSAYAPTYSHTGLFGESYVMDIPDLPLLLRLLANFDKGFDPLKDLSCNSERYCRERGIPVSYLEQYLVSIDNYLNDAARQIAGVRFVGFSTWTSNFLTTLLFAAHLKRLPYPPTIILGGPQVTESRACAALALKSRLADAVAIGEGEAVLLDVYSKFSESCTLECIPLPGTAMLGFDGEIVYGPKRRLLQSQNIPIPDFDQMPLLSYQEFGSRSIPYHFSRGCTDRCVFCSEWKFWEKFRPGDVLDTIEGVKKLQKDYGAEYISFTDSLLNGHPVRLRQFADSLLHERIDLRWDGFMRANMDIETARLLKSAGCDSVFVGIESMSNETLALMKKRRTEEHNVGALEAFLQAGIHVIAGVIPGFPKDERKAFFHTSERLGSLQKTHAGLLRINAEPFVVSPGQPLFASLEDFGLRGVPWDEETLDIAPRYRAITERVFCTVEGSNQGIERVGRLRIAESMESDEAERVDPFDYKGDEIPGGSRLEFEYLHAGWFLARIKSLAAWIYAAILTEQEKESLEKEMPDEFWGDSPAAESIRSKLSRIAEDHLVGPARLPRLPEGGYFRDRSSSTVYRLSPYVIARTGGWRTRYRVFAVDFYDLSWKLLPHWQGKLIQTLNSGFHTTETAQKTLSSAGEYVALSRCVRALQVLTEEGFVLVSDAPELNLRGSRPRPKLISEDVWKTGLETQRVAL
jgi:radical SAM superfamily enzyme YgiQ (UPF0313 family)